MFNLTNVQAFVSKFASVVKEACTVDDLLAAGFYGDREIKPLANRHELAMIDMYVTPDKEVACPMQVDFPVRVFTHQDSWGPECACNHPTLGWIVIYNTDNPFHEVVLAHELGHISNALSLGYFANKDEYLAWVVAELEILGRPLTAEEQEFKSAALRTYGCVGNTLTWGVMANHEYYKDSQVSKFANLFAESIRFGFVA